MRGLLLRCCSNVGKRCLSCTLCLSAWVGAAGLVHTTRRRAERARLAATWRDPDEPEHQEAVIVTGVADTDERRGVLLGMQRTNGKTRRAPAEQVWANDAQSANGVVLEDYRHWVSELNGLTPGFE